MAYLLVEDTIPLVDVGNVALILIVALPRELALLVDAKQGLHSVSVDSQNPSDSLLVDLADHTVNRLFTWLVVCIQQAVRVSVEILISELLLETRRSRLRQTELAPATATAYGWKVAYQSTA